MTIRGRTKAWLVILVLWTASAAAQTPVYLPQGWTPEDRDWFYYTSQGSRLIPYDWFLALEQAGNNDLFRDRAHMSALGFLAGPRSARNPDDLPIGFAADAEGTIEEAFELKASQLVYSLSAQEYANTLEPTADDLVSKYSAPLETPSIKKAARRTFPQQKKWVGLTCAACHTARLTGENGEFDVDGAPGQADITMFLQHLVKALEETTQAPEADKFLRFADRVLGANAGDEERANLYAEVVEYKGAIAGLEYRSRPTHPYGYARLDAFGILLNEIVGTAMELPENWRTPDAPVSYPQLWNTPDLDWVQWNGSVHSPLARNVGEVLGVFADLRLADLQAVRTSAKLRALFELEERIKKLEPPQWPAEHLGKIDTDKAAKGAKLYKQYHCIECHSLPPYPMTPAAEPTRLLIEIRMTPLQVVGTDPTMAVNFLTRTGATGPLTPLLGGRDQVPIGELLTAGVGTVIGSEFTRLKIPADERKLMNDRRGSKTPSAAHLASYKARPLAGIWATAPYLHNGSVPSLFELLLPPDRRSPTFHVGAWKFDPKNVGFVTDQGGFLFDTSLPGNRNIGHRFADDMKDDKRWELVEFLKTL